MSEAYNGVEVDGVKIISTFDNDFPMMMTYVVYLKDNVTVTFRMHDRGSFVRFNTDTYLSMLDEEANSLMDELLETETLNLADVLMHNSSALDCAFLGNCSLTATNVKNCVVDCSTLVVGDIDPTYWLHGYSICNSHLTNFRVEGTGEITDSRLTDIAIREHDLFLRVSVYRAHLEKVDLTAENSLEIISSTLTNSYIQTQETCYIRQQYLNNVELQAETLEMCDVWSFFELNVKVSTFYFVEVSKGVFCYIEKETGRCFGDAPKDGPDLFSKTPVHPDGSNGLHTYLNFVYEDVPFEGNYMSEIHDHLWLAYESRVNIIELVRSLAGYGQEED